MPATTVPAPVIESFPSALKMVEAELEPDATAMDWGSSYPKS